MNVWSRCVPPCTTIAWPAQGLVSLLPWPKGQVAVKAAEKAAGFGWAGRPRTLPPECDSTSEARSCPLGAQELPAWALLLLSLVSV